MYCAQPGAYEQEHATQLYFCHDVFIDRFIFRSNLLWMRPPWECHNQSQGTNWRHCVTGPELPLFHKTKVVLKIDQSVKMPWHRLSMGVASSCSSAPDTTSFSLSLFCPGNETGIACQNLLASHWVPSVHTISNTWQQPQIKFLRTPMFFCFFFFTTTGIASGSFRSARTTEKGETLRAADSSLRWKQ